MKNKCFTGRQRGCSLCGGTRKEQVRFFSGSVISFTISDEVFMNRCFLTWRDIAMRKFFAFLSVALMCTANVHAQVIDDEVVTLQLPSTVTVPAGNLTIVIFTSGSNAEINDAVAPENGDLFVVGGNTTGAPGLLASSGCGVTTLTDPTVLGGGFPNANFLVAAGDAAGNVLLSNHTDLTLVEAGTGLSCQVADPDGDPMTADQHTADNAWGQTISVASTTTIESVTFGVEIAIEGNNPLGVDTDGDGVGDSASIIDGIIPVEVFFFFGTPPTFSTDGPDTPADASFVLDLVVDPTIGGGAMVPTNFTQFRGLAVGTPDLTDFAGPDGVSANFNPGFVLNDLEAPVWLIFDYSGSASGDINVTSNAGTPGLSMTVEYADAAGSFGAINSQAIGTAGESFNTFTTETFTLPGVTTDRVRVGWRQTGFVINFPWEIRVDAVTLE